MVATATACILHGKRRRQYRVMYTQMRVEYIFKIGNFLCLPAYRKPSFITTLAQVVERLHTNKYIMRKHYYIY